MEELYMKQLSILHQASLVAVTLLGLLVGLSTTASAQYNPNYQSRSCSPQYNQSYNNGSNYSNSGYYQSTGQPGVINGYQIGYGQGSNDRAASRSFDIDRTKAY